MSRVAISESDRHKLRRHAFTTAGIAELLDVHESQVRELIRIGALHATDVGAGKTVQWRITREDYVAFCEARSSRNRRHLDDDGDEGEAQAQA